ncbi:hypothetical protein QTH91_19205 [Variovorax dokdonensis]|uniref:Uncharacterized protein n=1 Tax=Variovorax dokdonensis TaxID=344883 RepID=A0ABT7NFC8_9BURK|nr:hypothetical protein [Variovorax dokdonensis]MDM0046626.1 hypothetical protein [Variovorax dokdonensis]
MDLTCTRMGSGGAESYLSHEIERPGVPLQLRAIGSWATTTAGYTGQQTGQCGPLEARFTPQAGHAYTAEFVWADVTGCKLQIMDATEPDVPKPVIEQTPLACTRPTAK